MKTQNPVADLVSVQLGLDYWAESPEGGPEDLGLRLAVTLLFPK